MTSCKKQSATALTQNIHLDNARIKETLVKWTKTRLEVFGDSIINNNIDFSQEFLNGEPHVLAVIKNSEGTCVTTTVTLNEKNLRAILAAEYKAKIENVFLNTIYSEWGRPDEGPTKASLNGAVISKKITGPIAIPA